MSFENSTQIIILINLFCLAALIINAQNVSISPSRLYYKTAVGEYKVQEVSITNSATHNQSFVVSFGDFEASGVQGKSKFMKAGESENSCSQWLSADPSFFDLDAGQTKKIKVLLQVPSLPEANKVKWSSMLIKMAKEKSGKNFDSFLRHVGNTGSQITHGRCDGRRQIRRAFFH